MDKVALMEKLANLVEIQLIRRVRHGQIVKKAAIKKQGFKVVRNGNMAHYQKMSAMEMLHHRKSAKIAWRKGKARRLIKTRRSMIKARRKMKILYH
jgi:hypothetical protein